MNGSIKLKKYEGNPIISPRPESTWDSGGAFNPAAVKIGNKIYIVYRAITRDNTSVFGVAVTKDGYTIEERFDEPIYVPRKHFELHPSLRKISEMLNEEMHRLKIKLRHISGGSYSGVEDPRITRIGNRIYMTYVAFNGVENPRIAFTSISVNDFVQGNMNWDEPRVISHPNITDKGGALFPAKVKGKYMFFHRIFPHIWIDYVKDLSFSNGRFLFGKPHIHIRPHRWDSRKVGVGAPPLETDFGWLFVYQGISGWDPYHQHLGITPEMVKVHDYYRYKIGVMVLDKKDPEKVIYRSEEPVLEPDTWYEGPFAYPCGAVINHDKLFVYYGAGDYHVAVASVDLSEIREAVRSWEPPN